MSHAAKKLFRHAKSNFRSLRVVSPGSILILNSAHVDSFLYSDIAVVTKSISPRESDDPIICIPTIDCNDDGSDSSTPLVRICWEVSSNLLVGEEVLEDYNIGNQNSSRGSASTFGNHISLVVSVESNLAVGTRKLHLFSNLSGSSKDCCSGSLTGWRIAVLRAHSVDLASGAQKIVSANGLLGLSDTTINS